MINLLLLCAFASAGCPNGRCVEYAAEVFHDHAKAASYCSAAYDPDASCLAGAAKAYSFDPYARFSDPKPTSWRTAYSGYADKAKAYCQFTWDPKAQCLTDASKQFVKNYSSSLPSRIAKAAQYCTKAWDPDVRCLINAQQVYHSHFTTYSKLELSAAYCEKTTDPGATCLTDAYRTERDEEKAAAYCTAMTERHYAEDGRLYSESEFISWFSMRPNLCADGYEKWQRAAPEKRIAEDGRSYTAKEFLQWYRTVPGATPALWWSKWAAAPVAPRVSLVEGGSVVRRAS